MRKITRWVLTKAYKKKKNAKRFDRAKQKGTINVKETMKTMHHSSKYYQMRIFTYLRVYGIKANAERQLSMLRP